jgi:hypothetical protein
MPPRGAVFVEDPGRRLDPVALGVATHIAGHDPHMWLLPYSFDLTGVRERVDVERAVFFGKSHWGRHGPAVFPVGFQVEVSLACELGELMGAHAAVCSMMARVRRTDALPSKRLTALTQPCLEADARNSLRLYASAGAVCCAARL